jgi:hypothetical protein
MLEIRYNALFYINGFKIDFFTSNVLDKFLLRSFEKSSIINESKAINDKIQLSHSSNPNHFIENTERIKFVSSVSNVIDRISVLGFKKEHAIMDFEYCKNKIIDELSKLEYLDRVSRSFPEILTKLPLSQQFYIHQLQNARNKPLFANVCY